MGAEIVQANYEELAQLASRFGQQSDMITQMTGQVQRHFSVLARGSWVGDAAEAFTGEMESDLFPALERFTDALTSSQEVTTRVSEIIRAAEEEAEAIWRDWAIDGNLGAAGVGAAVGAAAAGAAGSSALPPPRIYVVNGINSTGADGQMPQDSSGFARFLAEHGYDPNQVSAVPAIYNTNINTHLQGTNLQGTNFGGILSPIDWLTGGGAAAVNGVTGVGASIINGGSGLVNTMIGVGEVVSEYTMGENGQYTQETYNFIQQDLQRNPLLEGQTVMLIGHSGGGAIVTNLTPMLETRLGVDVSGVVTMGSPVANGDAAMRYAPYTNITDRFDFGQPLIRSEEGRAFLAPGSVAGITNPSWLPVIAPGILLADQAARDPGVRYETTNSGHRNPLDAHGSYWSSTEVINILRTNYPQLQNHLQP